MWAFSFARFSKISVKTPSNFKITSKNVILYGQTKKATGNGLNCVFSD